MMKQSLDDLDLLNKILITEEKFDMHREEKICSRLTDGELEGNVYFSHWAIYDESYRISGWLSYYKKKSS